MSLLTFDDESHDQFPDGASDAGTRGRVRVLVRVAPRHIRTVFWGGGHGRVVVTQVSGIGSTAQHNTRQVNSITILLLTNT